MLSFVQPGTWVTLMTEHMGNTPMGLRDAESGGPGGGAPRSWGSRAKPAPSWLKRSAALRGQSPREEGVQGEETHRLWTTR
jgi:hypothetical protein